MIIDAHIHVGESDREFLALLKSYDLKLLNICYDASRNWREKAQLFRELSQKYPDRYAWCTTFDLPDFKDHNYATRVIRSLEEDFSKGAVACKIWKNIGMELKTPRGDYLMADDPILEPVFSFLEASNRTLLAHLAEPSACWQPLKVDNPHYWYYSNHPEWYMYNKPDAPKYSELIRVQDILLKKYPGLRIVGAHMGSLADNIRELALRLDRYENFAIDISARLVDLTLQDPEEVRHFFISYQDRILFGTDLVEPLPFKKMNAEERKKRIALISEVYRICFSYLESTGPVAIEDRSVQGLGLPAGVLNKIYRENAQKWYPDLLASTKAN